LSGGIDFALGHGIGQGSLEIGRTVKAEVAKLQMVDRKFPRRLSGLSAQNDNYGVIGDELINQDGIFFGEILVRAMDQGFSSRFPGWSVDLQSIELHEGDVRLLSHKALKIRVHGHFADFDQRRNIRAAFVAKHQSCDRDVNPGKQRNAEIRNLDLALEVSSQNGFDAIAKSGVNSRAEHVQSNHGNQYEHEHNRQRRANDPLSHENRAELSRPDQLQKQQA
jgi:hypothetical protein